VDVKPEEENLEVKAKEAEPEPVELPASEKQEPVIIEKPASVQEEKPSPEEQPQ
jgi:hypothetical protein